MRLMQNVLISAAILLGMEGCGSNSSNDVQINQAPVVVNDKITLTSENSIVLNILQNDYDVDGTIDKNSISIIHPPKYGNIEVLDGEVLYTRENNFIGEDSFTYRVSDTEGAVSKEASVTIVVVDQLPKRAIRDDDKDVQNWYMSFSVTNIDNGQRFSGLRLGEMSTQKDRNAPIKYSLKAFGGNGYPFVKIVSVDAEKVLSGEYTTLYKPSVDSNGKYWKFKVISSDAKAKMVLHWNGLYELAAYTDYTGRERFKSREDTGNTLLKKMKLVDLSNDTAVEAVYFDGKLQEYQFSMNGKHERWFKWVLSNQEVDRLKITPVYSRKYNTQTKKEHTVFDIKRPPNIEVRHE